MRKTVFAAIAIIGAWSCSGNSSNADAGPIDGGEFAKCAMEQRGALEASGWVESDGVAGIVDKVTSDAAVLPYCSP